MKRQTLGMRERQARKRHRRARVGTGAVVDMLKVGRKHYQRFCRRIHRQAVAEFEKRTNGAPGIN